MGMNGAAQREHHKATQRLADETTEAIGALADAMAARCTAAEAAAAEAVLQERLQRKAAFAHLAESARIQRDLLTALSLELRRPRRERRGLRGTWARLRWAVTGK